MEINSGNIGELVQLAPQRLADYRVVSFHQSLNDDIPLETIRKQAERIAEHVETVEIGEEITNDTLGAILAGVCTPRASRLKKLGISGAFVDNALLSALQSAASLEKLELRRARFTSPETARQFFTSSKTLKTLVLSGSTRMEGDQLSEVARAIRQGMQCNETFTAVHLTKIDAEILHFLLLGIKDNCHLQELLLCAGMSIHGTGNEVTFIDTLSDGTAAVIRELVSSTKSIQKICFRGCIDPDVIFLGLASNSSVQEVDMQLIRNLLPGGPNFDVKLASAIQKCSVKNNSLRVCTVRGIGPQAPVFGPRSREALLAMIPWMKGLKCIRGLFDFKPSESARQAAVAALVENSTLEEIKAWNENKELKAEEMEHLCNDKDVQFYLKLNRLGRANYIAASESKPIPAGVLPHLFARMTKPEDASPLYYFLRRTSPELLTGGPPEASGSSVFKRGAPTASLSGGDSL